MLGYVVRRLVYSIPVLLLASILVFVVVKKSTSPLAGIRNNPRVTVTDIHRYEHDLGLDKSGFSQYTSWLGNFVRGRWGKSIVSNRPVGPDIRRAVYNTAVLGLTAAILSLLIGIVIGVVSAVKQYSVFDYVSTSTAFVGLSIPTFWFGLILQIVVGIYMVHWFHLSHPLLANAGVETPGTTGFHLVDRLRHLGLPVIVLAVQLVAVYSRYMRASMLEVLNSDYLRTARAKGLPELRVIVRHGVRNALIPLTTQAAIDIGALAGGLIVTEQIFQWPGMGLLFLQSFRAGDFAVILPWMMVVVSSVIVFNLIADILYAVLDPRIRYA
jgi:peptide/nickel transport system permease protein